MNGPTIFNIFRPFKTLTLGSLLAFFVALPVRATDRIYAKYGPLETSVSVDSLKVYADTGKVNWELFPYFLFLQPYHQKTLNEFLQMRFGVGSVQVRQSLNSPMGKIFLQSLGEILRVRDGKNGSNALRETLFEVTENYGEFSVFELLQQFPGELQLNIAALLELANRIEGVITETETLNKALENMTIAIASTEPTVNYDDLPDPKQPGNLYVSKRILTVFDRDRDREIEVTFYYPSFPLEDTVPVIVISPGLGSTAVGWRPFAEHLSSHGFAVAIVRHPGSDFAHLQRFFEGEESESFKLGEFVDRPRDISFVLDELEQRNFSEFNGILDVENVGILGQSFGAYTALTLAGAPLNFDRLETNCRPPIDLLNLSLLLQCRALEVPRRSYQLKDDRIAAAFVVDPVNGAIFGPESLEKIAIPIFWASGSADLLTPVVLEQIDSVTSLSSPERYFALVRGANHVDFNPAAIAQFQALDEESLGQIVSSDPDVIASYMSAFGLAFFQVNLARNPDYRPFLRASYAGTIAREPYGLSFIPLLTTEQLERAIAELQK
ncbi:alpha/beta hydrolase [Lyngbya sp. CCY1209]|uniref:alpha/beta hydrolase n=1 Tax=Lyngbya sp. CCY1209 TaxID=2886103 RepID=UPI002D2101EE|nr:alpha/beta hydrolase [Lyngbya sp. CCY1209]MEB3886886.1 alpha/beta hydrolase [Lyngbya sp. CCY1209]